METRTGDSEARRAYSRSPTQGSPLLPESLLQGHQALLALRDSEALLRSADRMWHFLNLTTGTTADKQLGLLYTIISNLHSVKSDSPYPQVG